MGRTFIILRVQGRLHTRFKGNGRLGKSTLDTLDSVSDGGCRFQGQWKQTWFYNQTVWTNQFISTLALDVILVLDRWNYFQSCYGPLHVATALSLMDNK